MQDKYKHQAKYVKEKCASVTLHLRKDNPEEMDFYEFLQDGKQKAKILALYNFWKERA